MSLLINDNETFEVKVKYVLVADGIKYFEEDEQAPPEAISEWFKFKRPNWEETCEIMSYAMVPYNGTVILNPYRFIDGKLKVLLTAWSLKDEKGNPLELKPSNITRLNPALCEYLSAKLNVSSMPSIPEQVGQESQDKSPKQKGKKGKSQKQEMASMGPEPQKKFFEDEAKSTEVKLEETQSMPVQAPPEATTQ